MKIHFGFSDSGEEESENLLASKSWNCESYSRLLSSDMQRRIGQKIKSITGVMMVMMGWPQEESALEKEEQVEACVRVEEKLLLAQSGLVAPVQSTLVIYIYLGIATLL